MLSCVSWHIVASLLVQSQRQLKPLSCQAATSSHMILLLQSTLCSICFFTMISTFQAGHPGQATSSNYCRHFVMPSSHSSQTASCFLFLHVTPPSDSMLLTQGGLDKLQEAATTVDTLSRQAQSQRALLVQKQSEADEAMSSIQASMGQAAERRREVEVLRGRLHEDEAVLQDQRGGWGERCLFLLHVLGQWVH